MDEALSLCDAKAVAYMLGCGVVGHARSFATQRELICTLLQLLLSNVAPCKIDKSSSMKPLHFGGNSHFLIF